MMPTNEELIAGIEEKTNSLLTGIVEQKVKKMRKGIPETYTLCLCSNPACISNTFRGFEDDYTGHLILKCANCGKEIDTKIREKEWDVL